MQQRRASWSILALTGALALGGCESLDFENMFNPKKPLPGERRDVFPQGVPGIQQGVPAELVRGYQPPVEAQPEPEPQPPKPPPRRVAQPARPASPPRPPRQQQQAEEPQQSQQGWPAPAPTAGPQPTSAWPAPQPAQPQAAPAWPDPPRAGSTTR